MKGNKRQTGPGKWQLRVYVGRVDGKVRFHHEPFHGTARDADTRLSQLVAQQSQRGLSVHRGTVAALVAEWFDQKADELQPKTAEDYRKIIRAHIEPSGLGAMAASKVRVSHVSAFFRSLPSTEIARKAKTILNQSFVYGIVEEQVVANPVRDTPLPKQRKVKIVGPARSPEPDELMRVIRTAYTLDQDFGDLLCIAAFTGARTGEIAAWKVSDYHRDARTLTVQRAIDRHTNEPKVPKSDAGVRDIPLTDDAVALLDGYLARNDDLDDDDWLFPCKKREHYRPDGIAKRLERACGLCGADVKMHGIRSFFATQLLAKGNDPVTVARIMGHSNVSQTFGYARGVRAVERAAVETISRVLDTTEVGAARGLSLRAFRAG